MCEWIDLCSTTSKVCVYYPLSNVALKILPYLFETVILSSSFYTLDWLFLQ